MILYVDAENRPGNWTDGIELMSDRDEIRVYFAEEGYFYNTWQKQHKLTSKADCPVRFIKTEHEYCAAVISITADIVMAAENSDPGVVVILSGCSDHMLAADIIQEKYPDLTIGTEQSIRGAVKKYRLMEASSIDSFCKYLTEVYGEEAGAATFKYLEKLFRERTGTSYRFCRSCRRAVSKTADIAKCIYSKIRRTGK